MGRGAVGSGGGGRAQAGGQWRVPRSPEPPCSHRESVVSLKRKYLKSSGEEDVSLSQPSMDGVLDAIADEGCRSLLEEVFLDLEVGHLHPPCSGPWSSVEVLYVVQARCGSAAQLPRSSQ